MLNRTRNADQLNFIGLLDIDHLIADGGYYLANMLAEAEKKLNTFCREYIKNLDQIYLYWLTGFYENSRNQDNFFKKDFFDKLAGTDQLRKQIKNGVNEKEIRKSWQDDINEFKKIRKQYLLYPDFEGSRMVEND